MNESEVAWVAGIYEGEGCCTLRGRSSISVEIVMTDYDVVNRVHNLAGGRLYGPMPNRGHKDITRWSITGGDAIDFLRLIEPWLGKRRLAKVKEAYEHRKQRVSIRSEDTHCIHGHELTPENIRYSSKCKVCRICANLSSKRYKDKKKLERSSRTQPPTGKILNL